jgi:ribosomal protein S18 acetylase RimI-like enzyme
LTLSIREALPGEYGELSSLVTAAYQEFAGSLGSEWEGYRDDLADIARRAARGTQLIAETGGRLVGTVTYYPPVGDAAADEWWWWPKTFAYVRALAVHPDLRGAGIGRALTAACVEQARSEGAEGIALNTLDLMAGAMSLYHGLGFRQTDSAAEWRGRKLLSYLLDIDRGS